MAPLPTSGIGTTMVRNALKAATNSVNALCLHPKINKWSMLKPDPLSSEPNVFETGTAPNRFIINRVGVQTGIVSGVPVYEKRYAFHYFRLTDLARTIDRTMSGKWDPCLPFVNGVIGAQINPATMSLKCDIGDFRGYNHEAKKPRISKRLITYNLGSKNVEKITIYLEDVASYEANRALSGYSNYAPFNNHVLGFGAGFGYPTLVPGTEIMVTEKTIQNTALPSGTAVYYADTLQDVVDATGVDLSGLKTFNKVVYRVDQSDTSEDISNLIFLEEADAEGEYKDYGALIVFTADNSNNYYLYTRPNVTINEKNTFNRVSIPKTCLILSEFTYMHRITGGVEYMDFDIEFKTLVDGVAGYLAIDGTPAATALITLNLIMLDADGAPTSQQTQLAQFNVNNNIFRKGNATAYNEFALNDTSIFTWSHSVAVGDDAAYGTNRSGASWLADQLGKSVAELTNEDWHKCILSMDFNITTS